LELYQHATHSRINPSISSSTHPFALPASTQNNLTTLKDHALKKIHKPTKNQKKEKKKNCKGGKKLEKRNQSKNGEALAQETNS
jgi:hypothetical protein